MELGIKGPNGCQGDGEKRRSIFLESLAIKMRLKKRPIIDDTIFAENRMPKEAMLNGVTNHVSGLNAVFIGSIDDAGREAKVVKVSLMVKGNTATILRTIWKKIRIENMFRAQARDVGSTQEGISRNEGRDITGIGHHRRI